MDCFCNIFDHDTSKDYNKATDKFIATDAASATDDALRSRKPSMHSLMMKLTMQMRQELVQLMWCAGLLRTQSKKSKLLSWE